MHEEPLSCPSPRRMINETHRRAVALCAGTTTVRSWKPVSIPQDGIVVPRPANQDFPISAEAREFGLPVDEFHLPKSTLLMLVCTFCDYKHVFSAYRYAVDQRMRFFSYGDCMFLHRIETDANWSKPMFAWCAVPLRRSIQALCRAGERIGQVC